MGIYLVMLLPISLLISLGIGLSLRRSFPEKPPEAEETRA